MSKKHRYAARVVPLVLGLLVGVPSWVLAQSAPERAEADKASSASVPTDVYLYVRIHPPKTLAAAIESLEEGATLEKCEFAGLGAADGSGSRRIDIAKLNPKQISSVTFNELQVDLNKQTTDDEDGPVKSASGKVSVQQLPARTPVYEFALDEAGTVLQSLEITVKDGEGKERVKSMTPAAFTHKDAELRMTQPGRYVLRVEEGTEPVRYVAKIQALDGSARDDDKGDWPVEDRYYRIELKQFRGNLQQMLDAVRPASEGKEARVANPIDFGITRDFQLVFGSVGGKLRDIKDPFDEHGMKLIVDALKDNSSSRVWIYFPLKEADVEKAWNEYRSLSPADLSKRIGEQSPLKHDATESWTLTADSTPRWVELGRTEEGEGAFTRYVKFQDFLKVYESYPELWHLVCYEFDKPNDPFPAKAQMIPVGNVPANLTQPVDKNKEYVTVPQINQQWSKGARAIVEKKPGAEVAAPKPAGK